MTPFVTSRRAYLGILGAGGLAAWLPAGPAAAAATAQPSAAPAGWLDTDGVAATYHRALLRHTRWSETQWDEAAGHYRVTDFGFAVVLGHAVLLTRGSYDADEAGVDADTLRSRTVRTLQHFGATNRLVGGSEWGKTLFWDTTFQSYVQLAARLLWDDLDEATRRSFDDIAAEQAAYTVSLGTGDDPRSGSWTPNGLTGGWKGDTKLEEMGVYAQSIAPGLAWAHDDGRADDWAAAFGRWSRNEAGLPQADAANPTLVDGVPVSDNTAHNVYDTFVVENHGSFGPHYECELWRTSGRNSAHFLVAGRPLPEVLTHQPNGDALWERIVGVMSDAGEPLMPLVDDREHLYGRDVIPIAFLAQVLGDRRAARAEADLADRLLPYLDYPPEARLTKFSGEPKYEPEARAEVAISLLLHEWRAAHGGATSPVSADELFASAAGAVDLGSGPGIVSHQSPGAWAGAISKAGFVKLAWQPEHDDWFFNLGGASPMYLPSTSVGVTDRSVRTYAAPRDGFDASATVLTLDGGGRVGMSTLPDGSVVMTSSGAVDREGTFGMHNLTMPGVRGLDGSRTFVTPDGRYEASASDAAGDLPSGVARRDVLDLGGVTARHVRMLGERGDPKYGYSIWSLEVRGDADGPDLAAHRPTTASSQDGGKEAVLATDADAGTRWAVSRADRTRGDSWLAVDLGSATDVAQVTIDWEAASGRAYVVQTSDDGEHWTTRAEYPRVLQSSGWVGIEDRVAFLVRGSDNPIEVGDDVLTLSAGPASGSAGMVVEGLLDVRSADLAGLAAAAEAAAPRVDADGVTASLAGGHLSVFDLTGDAVRVEVTLPRADRGSVTCFAGTQRLTDDASVLTVPVAAASGVVLAPRATVSAARGTLPAGLVVEVVDAATVTLTGADVLVDVELADGSRSRRPVSASRTTTVRGKGPAYPIADLALARQTFPTSPLPPTMTSPAAAVDGDTSTSWDVTGSGRMVLDLGRTRDLGTAHVEWGTPSGRGTVSVSDDGLEFREVGKVAPGSRSTVDVGTSARYVALEVEAPGSSGRRVSVVGFGVSPA